MMSGMENTRTTAMLTEWLEEQRGLLLTPIKQGEGINNLEECREPQDGERSKLPSRCATMSTLSLRSLEERSKERHLLRTVLAQNRPEVVRELRADQAFLKIMVQYRLLEQAEMDTLLDIPSDLDRNKSLIDAVVKHSTVVTDSYGKLIEALNKTEQKHLAGILTSVDRELDVVGQSQNNLANHLNDINSYLKKQSRRAEVKFTTRSPKSSREESSPHGSVPASYSAAEREDMTSFLYKVHQTTKSTIVQFDRCREVIDKLHRDCNDTAGRNADITNKLRDCDDLVKTVVPPITYPGASSQRNEEMSLVPAHQNPRNRSDESESMMSSIRMNLARMDEAIRTMEDDQEATKSILEAVVEDIKTRRRLLGRMTEPLSRNEHENNKYLTALVPVDPDNQLVLHRAPALRKTAEQLANEIFVYMDQERQLALRASVANAREGPVNHRNFDQVDKDLYHLRREVKKQDPATAQVLVNHVVDVTRMEREDCVKLVNEIETTVKARRQKLQEAGRKDKKKRKRMTVHRKRKVVRSINSNFSKKLVDLDKEVRTVMDLDKEEAERQKEEYIHKRQEFETEVKSKAQTIRELEKKIRQVENEKDKYRKLYTQEKAVKSSRMLTKAVIPSRASYNGNAVSLEPLGTEPNRFKPMLTTRARHLTHLRDHQGFRPNRKEARVKPMLRKEPSALKIQPLRKPGRPSVATKVIEPELPLYSESTFKTTDTALIPHF